MTASGLLVIRKPRGPTSHDIVAQARRLFQTREVGHAGTLDPMATGVLVLLVGEATKLAAYLSLEEKEYRATVAFGRSTDTLDAEGITVDERPLAPGVPDADALDAALAAEATRTEQVPPAFSAISVGGKRAHRLARRGEAPLLEPRPVKVTSLRLVDHGPAIAIVELAVSKGYYVRSFARDLGVRLGVPAHLAALERLRSGPYRIDEAHPWPPAEPPPLVPLPDAARHVLPPALLTPEGVERARCGKRLGAEHFGEAVPAGPHAAWLGPDGALVAIGQPDGEGGYRVVRGFRPGEPDPRAAGS